MRLLRLKEVKKLTSLGRTSIYNYMEDGRFPKSVKLGERAVAWVESEIEEWIQQRIQSRDS
jgi:prophage regulatory protein